MEGERERGKVRGRKGMRRSGECEKEKLKGRRDEVRRGRGGESPAYSDLCDFARAHSGF